MVTLINKDKQISKQRQDFVEHNFEAMVGARKRRYNDTPQQKQRTEFFEDYYLLYTRTKDKWQKLKEWLKLQIDGLNEQLVDYDFDSDCREISIENFKIMLQQMQELEAEDVED